MGRPIERGTRSSIARRDQALPPQLASADALARLNEREAKAAGVVASNILAIFGFGKEGGIAYAVMELLDGATLRDRIGRPAWAASKGLKRGASSVRGANLAAQRSTTP